REPAYRYLLKREFKEHGCALKALNDRGDDSPEGELTEGILDQIAKFERAKIAERTRRGMLRRVREGNPNVTGQPRYGFRYNEAKDALLIYEPEMRVVEKIFRMAAEGLGLHAIQGHLYSAGVPTATGKPVWDVQMIRRVIASDMYRPHSFEEVSGLVASEVAARLDPDGEYGIQWYNRQRVTERTVSEPDNNGGRRYRKKRTFRWRPKEEWIAIPVPAYLPRELVDRARSLVGSGRARKRKHLAREWELRGMMRCGCGRKMGTRTAQSSGRLFHYYVCKRSPAARKVGECAQRCVRATRVKDVVWRFVSELLKDPDRIKVGLEELIEQEREAGRDDPKQEAQLWEERIEECSRLRSAYQDRQAAGLMTLEELGSKLAKLEETRRFAEAELRALDAREERVRELEADRDAFVASYAEVVPEALDALSGEGRMRVYEMLRLEVKPDTEGYEISGALCSRRPRGRYRSGRSSGSRVCGPCRHGDRGR
ncbi:MAG TPA: recombinase family protein, partial [Rubrobacteraceae bacterium]|nr:recombinase family protein [Rubrobacteraceae bacterium]